MPLLPERLDYDESSPEEPDGEWYPVVVCRTPGCRWVYHATWSDLAEDGDVDWDDEHPAHDSTALPEGGTR